MNDKRISEIVSEELMKQDAEAYRQLRERLTIPKSVADYYEKIKRYMDIGNTDWKKSKPTEQEEQEQRAWREEGKNEHIYKIFLASKELGIELVKVVE